jgi:hypothetical protein
MNLELGKLDQPWRALAKLTGNVYPHGQIFFGMRLPLLLQRKKADAAFHAICRWDPQRIVISHGRCIEAETGEVVDRIFGAGSKVLPSATGRI